MKAPKEPKLTPAEKLVHRAIADVIAAQMQTRDATMSPLHASTKAIAKRTVKAYMKKNKALIEAKALRLAKFACQEAMKKMRVDVDVRGVMGAHHKVWRDRD